MCDEAFNVVIIKFITKHRRQVTFILSLESSYLPSTMCLLPVVHNYQLTGSFKFQMTILQLHCYFLLKQCENPLQQKITMYVLLKSIYT